jgi:hypothetical protein
MSKELHAALQAWSDERTEWDSCPPASAHEAVEGIGESEWNDSFRDWMKRGRALTERLQRELGDEYEVVFFNDETGKLEEVGTIADRASGGHMSKEEAVHATLLIEEPAVIAVALFAGLVWLLRKTLRWRGARRR